MAPRFERTPAARGPVVRGVTDGCFTVDGERYSALLLTPERAAGWDAPTALADLQAAHIAPLLALDPAPEFLILGTGPFMAFPPRAFVQEMEARGIGVEAMDSRAAARTWGILRSEERWIVAALLPI
jgi:uncharacterized protein